MADGDFPYTGYDANTQIKGRGQWFPGSRVGLTRVCENNAKQAIIAAVKRDQPSQEAQALK